MLKYRFDLTRFVSGFFKGFFVLILVVTCFVSATQASEVPPKPRAFIWLPFAFYTPETQTALGSLLRWNGQSHIMGRVNQLNIISVYTQNRQSFITLSPRYYLNNGWDELAVGLSYFDYPDRFYGRGDTGYFQEPEIFFEKRFAGSFFYSKHLMDHWFLKGGFSFENRNFSSDTQSANLALEWSQHPSHFQNSCLSLGLEYDSRDFVESPTEGQYHRVTLNRCQLLNRAEFEGRYYQKYDKGVWANQVYLAQASGESVPFSALIPIGGRNMLRGNFVGRYRDLAANVVQSEWRQPINERWMWVAFVGAGELKDQLVSPRRSQFASSMGGGIHYFLDPAARTKLRIEYGASHERTFGFYFVNGEAF